LRNNPTKAEWVLWQHLRGSQLNGYKFTRQFPVGPFVVDFCCRSEQLVVEVDGGGHDLSRANGLRRTRLLRTSGYSVLRFWNTDVLTNLEGVMETISAALAQRTAVRREDLSPLME
jgi:very-short-patch-repair endonuclease